MAVSGPRAGEALGLDRGAVDLQDGALQVRRGKDGKQREVPLHETTIHALRDYSHLRDLLLPQPATAAFFVSPLGSRLTANAFNRWFRKLIGQVGLEGAGQRARPRPHDVRHTYAVRTLIDWYQADEKPWFLAEARP